MSAIEDVAPPTPSRTLAPQCSDRLRRGAYHRRPAGELHPSFGCRGSRLRAVNLAVALRLLALLAWAVLAVVCVVVFGLVARRARGCCGLCGARGGDRHGHRARGVSFRTGSSCPRQPWRSSCRRCATPVSSSSSPLARGRRLLPRAGARLPGGARDGGRQARRLPRRLARVRARRASRRLAPRGCHGDDHARAPRGEGRKTILPYGPALAVGGVAGLFIGEP